MERFPTYIVKEKKREGILCRAHVLIIMIIIATWLKVMKVTVLSTL